MLNCSVPVILRPQLSHQHSPPYKLIGASLIEDVMNGQFFDSKRYLESPLEECKILPSGRQGLWPEESAGSEGRPEKPSIEQELESRPALATGVTTAIRASKLKVTSLEAATIRATEIKATEIYADTITATRIVAAEVKAEKIYTQPGVESSYSTAADAVLKGFLMNWTCVSCIQTPPMYYRSLLIAHNLTEMWR